MEDQCLTHPFPAREERGNTIIHALVEESPAEALWEELWVRDLGSNMFEVCCIPLWVRNLSIGDIVAATPDSKKGWILKEVIQPSGDCTFRIWFAEPPAEEVMKRLHDELRAFGCLLEWRSDRLWGVSCRPESAQTVRDLLMDWERRGIIEYETGWT